MRLRLQAELNPAQADEPVVEKFGWQFRVRDKVIQTENNYDKEVFNGDIGQVAKIDPLEREVTVRYNQREVAYDYGELDEVALAYAITIHKSQGSEFPVVVIPLAMQQYQGEGSDHSMGRFCIAATRQRRYRLRLCHANCESNIPRRPVPRHEPGRPARGHFPGRRESTGLAQDPRRGVPENRLTGK